MDFIFNIALLAGGLFAGMLVLLEIGRRLGLRRLALDSEAVRAGFGVVEGAIFALMGLLIAFTFSEAASRFDTRRQLVVEEANAIGTAYLRLDLLSASAQPHCARVSGVMWMRAWTCIGSSRTSPRPSRR